MKDSDDCLMAEKIGSLQEEIKSLRNKNRDLSHQVQTEQRRNIFERAPIGLAILLATAFVLALAGYPIYKTFTTSTTPTSCEVEFSQGQCGDRYTLYGIIPWHTDPSYGNYNTLEEAIEAAEIRGCSISNIPNR